MRLNRPFPQEALFFTTWHESAIYVAQIGGTFGSNQPREFETQLIFPSCGFQAFLGKVENLEYSVRTRHIRKVYPSMPFDIAEFELSRELEIYYQAIHSYPDHFARTRLSFQQHLLNIMGHVQAGSHDAGAEYMKSAS